MDKYLKREMALMNTAHVWSNMSVATRKKVGCVLSKDGRIISIGYNGTPSGFDNCCEDANGDTRPEVVHAEMNAIAFAAKEGISTVGAHMHITLSPCDNCAKLIIQAGITRVVYKDEYRDKTGIQVLTEAGVKVECIDELYEF